MSLLRFCALIVVISLLSMEGQKALGFNQKYLNLCSEDERRSYGFGTTWGWVINDIFFIFGWTILLKETLHGHICSEIHYICDHLHPWPEPFQNGVWMVQCFQDLLEVLKPVYTLWLDHPRQMLIPEENWSSDDCVSGMPPVFIKEYSSIWSPAILFSRLTVFQRAKDILYTCYSSVCSIHLVKQLTDCLAFHWIKHILVNKGRHPKQKKCNYYMRSRLCVTPALSKRAR